MQKQFRGYLDSISKNVGICPGTPEQASRQRQRESQQLMMVRMTMLVQQQVTSSAVSRQQASAGGRAARAAGAGPAIPWLEDASWLVMVVLAQACKEWKTLRVVVADLVAVEVEEALGAQ